MTNKTTITINGRLYDAISGSPVNGREHPRPSKGEEAQPPLKAFSDIGPRTPLKNLTKPAGPSIQFDSSLRPISASATPPAAHHTAQNVHQRPQKSQTLYRKALKRPEHPAAEQTHPAPEASQTPAPIHKHERSPMISRFAAPTQTTPAEPTPPPQIVEKLNVTPVHSSVVRAVQRQAMQKTTPSLPEEPQSGKELKEMLIKERLAEVGEPPEHPHEHRARRQPRIVTILASTLSLLILGGYITYMHLPDISMKVAASRAGVDATFPNYQPDGYSLNGPITYAPGEIIINYKSNSNENGFRLTEKASNWDSQAVLDNLVTKQSENYLTFHERGVTVYTFDNKAAWVNGGLLYTIDGDATLSSEQILRVATSM